MRDINKAIEYEKEYQAARVNGEYPFHLVDKIKECGFESIKEYHELKKTHQFEQLNFEYIETNPRECLKDVFKVMALGKTCFLFSDTDETFVFNGNANYNQDYCLNHNIPIYPIQTSGGTIVSSKGDLSFGVCCPKTNGIDRNYVLNGLKNVLQKHTAAIVTVDGNDILVGDKKVIGSASYWQNNVFMFVCHISFCDNTELISNICITSKVGKTVGYIDFMTREEFKQGVSEWLLTNSI